MSHHSWCSPEFVRVDIQTHLPELALHFRHREGGVPPEGENLSKHVWRGVEAALRNGLLDYIVDVSKELPLRSLTTTGAFYRKENGHELCPRDALRFSVFMST